MRLSISFACLMAVATSVLTINAGCTSVKARPGLTRIDGAYEQFVAAPPEAVVAAANQTLREYNLMMIQSGSSDRGAAQQVVMARNQQDTRVTVLVEPAMPAGTGTRYTVRVEPGHGEGLSTAVINSINARLGVSRMSPQIQG